MVKKNGQNNGSQGSQRRNQAQFGTFVRCELTADDKKHLAALPYDPARLFEWQMDMVEKGYKISVASDENGKGCLASAYDKSATESHRYHTLTARGKDAHDALLALCHKHEHVMGGIWFSVEESLGDWG